MSKHQSYMFNPNKKLLFENTKDEVSSPIVMLKPQRGREMITKEIPTDFLDPMKDPEKKVQSKGLVPEEQRPVGEFYHEGYVDGKLYLVPDSTLEAMKDIVNLKMQPRLSERFKHQSSFEVTDFDHFREKMSILREKMDDFLPSSISESVESETALELEGKPEGEIEAESEEDIEAETEEEIEPESEEEIEGDSGEGSIESVLTVPEVPIVQPLPPPNEYYLRFLVSGHFLKDKKPIYIIQDYDGEPDLFKEQKAQFSTFKKSGDVDIFISGKYFSENILEEFQGTPVALKTKPNKIVIDQDRSNVYDKDFENLYPMKTADISLRGEFITSEITNKITPFLTLGVKGKSGGKSNSRRVKSREIPSNNLSSFNEKEKIIINNNQTPIINYTSSRPSKNVFNNEKSTTVLVYNSDEDNPFYRVKEHVKEDKHLEKGDHNLSDSNSSTLTVQSSLSTRSSLLTFSQFSSSDNVTSDSDSKLLLAEKVGEPVSETAGFAKRKTTPPLKTTKSREKDLILKQNSSTGDVLNNNQQTKHTTKEDTLLNLLKQNVLYKSLFSKKETKPKVVKPIKSHQKLEEKNFNTYTEIPGLSETTTTTEGKPRAGVNIPKEQRRTRNKSRSKIKFSKP